MARAKDAFDEILDDIGHDVISEEDAAAVDAEEGVEVEAAPEPAPEPDPKPKPDEPAPKPEAPIAAVEPVEGEAGTVSAGGDEPTTTDKEAALLKEITKLRAKNRTIQAQAEQQRAGVSSVTPEAPPVGGAPLPAPSPAASGGLSVAPEPLIFEGGVAKSNPAYESYLIDQATQRPQQAMQPDPYTRAAQRSESLKNAWVGAQPNDYAQRVESVNRVSQSMEHFHLLLQDQLQANQVDPSRLGPDGLMQFAEDVGVAGTIREAYPDVGAVLPELVMANFSDSDMYARVALDRYHALRTMQAPSEAGDATPPSVPGNGGASSPHVAPRPLVQGRPPSMAVRGVGTEGDQQSTDEQRLAELEAKENKDPFGFSKELNAELTALQQKLQVMG